MQSEAYKITGFTAVISAMGFMLRWLQNMRIIDEETGLATRMMGISWLMVVLLVAVAGVIAGFVFLFRRYDAPTEPVKALGRRTFLFTVFGVIAAVMLAYAGVAQLLNAGTQMWPVVHRLCGIAMLVGAAGAALFTLNAGKPEKAGARRAGTGMLLIFGCFWLVTAYKDAASDPVIWHFAIEILAACAALVAFYYIAGYQFEEPHPFAAIIFCYYGAFLCVVSAIDEHPVYESVCFAATALLLFTWGFTLVENLSKTARPLTITEEKIE